MNIKKEDKKLRVFVLFGNSASSIRFLSEHDDNFGKKYEVVGALTDCPSAQATKFFADLSGLCEIFPIRKFHERMDVSINDVLARRLYYEKMRRIIEGYSPDLIICSGWMWIIGDPLLSAYKERMINVHPADLSIIMDDGTPKYRGVDAVKKAIFAGEGKLRSTIHYVSADIDCGEIICVSPHELHVVRELAPSWHQEQMKLLCDGPAMRLALEKLTALVPQKV